MFKKWFLQSKDTPIYFNFWSPENENVSKSSHRRYICLCFFSLFTIKTWMCSIACVCVLALLCAHVEIRHSGGGDSEWDEIELHLRQIFCFFFWKKTVENVVLKIEVSRWTVCWNINFFIKVKSFSSWNLIAVSCLRPFPLSATIWPIFLLNFE